MRMFATTIAVLATVSLGGCNVLSFGKKDVASAATQALPAATPGQAQKFVIAANPIAAEAGMAVLRKGGSAVDAAIAVQAMLSLVEPQSSGLGGGAFLTYFNAKTGKVEIYDGREVAPAGATPTMLLGT
ncbi:gamma-glutamyltransferase, partial [uncultured Sphingomonas sp.]|uniref:gamma-glutamyltransferase n=1 Tax=uncultured Sphingomonas sp. TaxID=158754 RepID=UPI0025EDA60C